MDHAIITAALALRNRICRRWRPFRAGLLGQAAGQLGALAARIRDLQATACRESERAAAAEAQVSALQQQLMRERLAQHRLAAELEQSIAAADRLRAELADARERLARVTLRRRA
jgi:chromosome segregation ATPase